MGTFLSGIKSIHTKIATPGDWFRYNDLGGGIFDPTSYSTVNANIINELRGATSASHYVLYSSTATPWVPFAGTPGTATISFLLDLANVVTDLGTLSGYQLPLGFRVLTANFKRPGTNAADAGGTTGTNIQRDGQTILAIFPDPGTNSTVALVINADTPLSVLGSTYGIQFVSTGAQSTIASDAGGLRVEGTYSIMNYAWLIGNGIAYTPSGTTIAGKLFMPGAVMKITSGYPGTGPRAGGSADTGNILNIYDDLNNPLGTGPDLLESGITSIGFTWIDSDSVVHTLTVDNDDFEDWSSIYFWFYLPDELPKDIDISVTAFGEELPDLTGTQFSGSVKLGVLRILGVQASGIYTLVPDKTNDTLYVNSPTTNATEDFAIPDPFAKTGFIGG